MSISKSAISSERFDPGVDKIALMLQSFRLLKKTDNFRYAEPYVVGFSVSGNQRTEQPFEFVFQTYPNTRKGELKDFKGDGLRLYGPANPGEYLAFSILLMESDADVRETGRMIQEALDSKLLKDTLPALVMANPTAAIATQLLTEVTNIVSGIMSKNKDDELLRMSGTLFQNVIGTSYLPYRIKENFKDQNHKAEIEVRVEALAGADRHKKHSVSVDIS